MKNKKYIDLIIEDEEEKKEPASAKENKKESFLKKISFPRFSFSLTPLKYLLLIFILAVFVYLHFVKFEALVEVRPKLLNSSTQENILLKKGALADFSSFTLPFEVLETETEASQNFPASFVEQERKAEGYVEVYNLYSLTPFVLVANTRFLSADGKLFRSPQRIVIPGKRKVGDKWEPGVVKVKLVAAEPGPQYNIGPTTFSIPGLASSPAYTLIYAKSKEPMRGGFSGKGRMVLEKDLKEAQKVLESKIKKDALSVLSQKFDSKFKIIKETLKVDILKVESSAKVKEVEDNFNFKVKAKISALGVPLNDLKDLASYLLSLSAPEDKEIIKDSLAFSLSFENKENLNFNQEELKAVLKVEGKFAEKFSQSELVFSILGKSQREAYFLLNNQFDKVKIKVSPFWRKTIPQNPEKVKLRIILD